MGCGASASKNRGDVYTATVDTEQEFDNSTKEQLAKPEVKEVTLTAPAVKEEASTAGNVAVAADAVAKNATLEEKKDAQTTENAKEGEDREAHGAEEKNRLDERRQKFKDDKALRQSASTSQVLADPDPPATCLEIPESDAAPTASEDPPDPRKTVDAPAPHEAWDSLQPTRKSILMLDATAEEEEGAAVAKDDLKVENVSDEGDLAGETHVEVPSAQDTPVLDEAPASEAGPRIQIAPPIEERVEEAPAATQKQTPAAKVQAEEPKTEARAEETVVAEEIVVAETPVAEETQAAEGVYAAEEAPREEPLVLEETTVEAAPTEEAPAFEEIPVEEAPAKQAPAVEETSAEEAPTKETHAIEEIPVEKTLTAEASAVEEIPTDEVAADETYTVEKNGTEESPTAETPAAEEAAKGDPTDSFLERLPTSFCGTTSKVRASGFGSG